MSKLLRFIGLIYLVLFTQFSYGQTNKEIAFSKGVEAIKLMDNGKIDESIKLLEEAAQLDPDKIDFPYELAYAHYLKEDYKGTIIILEKYLEHKDVTEQFFQLLGNSYDMLSDSIKSIESYDAGLKKFPSSGMIYLEKGNISWMKKDINKALSFYEKGIEVDPGFPSNYYRSTLIYCRSTEEVWGMMYGEIFMNLERNSKRTAEISKLLFDTYKSEIILTNDTSKSVNFCEKNNIISIDNLKSDKYKPTFSMLYEMTLILSIISEKSIDINSLDRIRQNFVEFYFSMGHDATNPNVLFEYQDKILKAGHLEAYNHWLLMKGDEDGFNKWLSANKEKWENFLKWFSVNKLKIDYLNKFHSNQN